MEGRGSAGSDLSSTQNAPVSVRAGRSKPIRRRCCGLWISSPTPPSMAGKAIKIASMIDEHTRGSLLNIVERSITAQRMTGELDKAFAL